MVKPGPDYPDEPAQVSLRDRLVRIRIGWKESEFGSKELDVLGVLFGKILKYHASERIEAEEIVRLMLMTWKKGMVCLEDHEKSPLHLVKPGVLPR